MRARVSAGPVVRRHKNTSPFQSRPAAVVSGVRGKCITEAAVLGEHKERNNYTGGVVAAFLFNSYNILTVPRLTKWDSVDTEI